MAPLSKVNRFATEIVDDSEPEREEQRKIRTGKRRPGVECHPNTRGRERIPDREPSQCLPCILGNGNYNSHFVVDISDESSDFGVCVPSDSSHALPGSSKTIIDSSAQVMVHMKNVSATEPVDIPNHIALTSGPSDAEELQPDMDIAQFAYKTSSSTSRFTLPQSTTINSAVPPKKALLRGATHRKEAGFAGVALDKLMRCVSCDARWTTRKTTSQKLHHVRLCAKRNGYNEETVGILIRKEVDSITAQTEKDTRTIRQDLGPPKTLFEDYVAHPTSKRKGARHEKQPTIKNVVDTRPVLLDRAQAVLGRRDVSTALHGFSRDQSANPILENQNVSTQQFGQSNLALMHNRPTSTSLFSFGLHAEKIDKHIDPPATQAFAPSRFGSTNVPRCERSPSPPNCIAQPFLGSVLDRDVQIPSTVSIRNARIKNSVKLSSQGFLANNLYQYHVSQDTLDATADLESSGALSLTKKRRDAPKHVRFNSDLRVTPPRIKPTPHANAYGKNWEQSMKSKICRDEDLYSRILRYEPVQFDTFSKIALEDNIVSIKLKDSLIKFLDKEAINFHKGEARKK